MRMDMVEEPDVVLVRQLNHPNHLLPRILKPLLMFIAYYEIYSNLHLSKILCLPQPLNQIC